MSHGPYVWNTNQSIKIELFIGDTNNGLGLTGQASFAEVTIQRDSDSKYWTGSTWSSTRTTLTPTEENSANYPGRYTVTLPASANSAADRYVVYSNVSNSPTVEGDDYEIHVSRDTDVKLYESEPV